MMLEDWHKTSSFYNLQFTYIQTIEQVFITVNPICGAVRISYLLLVNYYEMQRKWNWNKFQNDTRLRTEYQTSVM
jgi:hypothetical protein